MFIPQWSEVVARASASAQRTPPPEQRTPPPALTPILTPTPTLTFSGRHYVEVGFAYLAAMQHGGYDEEAVEEALQRCALSVFSRLCPGRLRGGS